jgi:uncharacterized protein (TIGR02246 family)
MFRLALCMAVLSTFVLALAQKGADADTNAIRNVVDHLAEAWNRHDAHAFALAFAPDADFTNILGQGASGRSNIEEFHARSFASVFKNSKLTILDVKTRFLRPDIAAVDVRWTLAGMLDPQGAPRPDRRGLLNFVMTKDAGQWQITVMHNMDLPPEQP